jgi:hypothetical protein
MFGGLFGRKKEKAPERPNPKAKLDEVCAMRTRACVAFLFSAPPVKRALHALQLLV